MRYREGYGCVIGLLFVVFAETAMKSETVVLLGEISSKAVVDYDEVVRQTVKAIGYDDLSKGDRS